MIMAYLGLGSNLGNRRQNLQTTVIRLRHQSVFLERASSLYETQPIGFTEQPPFYNAVIAVRLGLTARQLLAVIADIEQGLGRRRTVRWGPRSIDIDILLYGNKTVAEPDLQIPHPRLHERAFVLVPLAELVPELILPDGSRIAGLLAAIDSSGVKKIMAGWCNQPG